MSNTATVEPKEKVVKPTPYRNAYQANLDEPDNDADAQSAQADPDQDTQDGQDTDDQDGLGNAEDNKKSQASVDWEKRYGDLRRFHDQKIRELTEKIQETAPKTQETKPDTEQLAVPADIQAWMEKYPQVARVVKTIAGKEAEIRKKEVADEVAAIKQDNLKLMRERARSELLRLHPDLDTMRNDQDFHDWVKEQPSGIQDALYKNFTDPHMAARAIDLYKHDKGITTNKKQADVNTRKKAAESVKGGSAKPDTQPKGKVWTTSEIAKLRPDQFEKLEDELDLASREGRIVEDQR